MRRRAGRSAKPSRKVDPAIGNVVDISIDEIGSSGDGIGRCDAQPVYVPLALPGDALTVRLCARRGAGYAAEMVEGSTLMPRQQPICRHFGACGGCRLQHLRPVDYRAWKYRKVMSALTSRGIDGVEIKPLIDGAPAARRRLRLAFRPEGQSVSLGFRRRQDSKIVTIEHCPIALSAIVDLLTSLRGILRSLDLSAKGGEVSITAADNGLDLLIETPIEPGLADREALAAFADAKDLARLAWRSDARASAEPIAVRRQPIVDFGGVPVALPTGAFLQATKQAENAIRSTVESVVGTSETIVDLFSGCGTLSLPFAEEGRRVQAVERDPAMIQALSAAADTRGLTSKVRTMIRDLDREPLSPHELQHAQALIIDPPRAGARAQTEAIVASSSPERIAMVSCNPTTFARDARILIDGGYRLNSVQPIDAFLYAAEIELVGAFERAITP